MRWNIATDEKEVDHWKSEIITFVVEFCFQFSSVVYFKVKVEGRSSLLSVSSIIHFKLIWIDLMQIITESCIVPWQNLIYIAESGIKCLG
jgi:hypothetical protein